MSHFVRVLVRGLFFVAAVAAFGAVVARTGLAHASLRQFVTRRFNPLVVRLGLVGGRRSPWAFVEHVGRRSGTTYRTPVLPVLAGDHVYVPLPYGPDAQWTQNVRAAGHCRLQRHDAILELDEPAVVPAADNLALPAWYRRLFGQRLYPYLRLHVLREQPGHLVQEPAAAISGTEPQPAPA